MVLFKNRDPSAKHNTSVVILLMVVSWRNSFLSAKPTPNHHRSSANATLMALACLGSGMLKSLKDKY